MIKHSNCEQNLSQGLITYPSLHTARPQAFWGLGQKTNLKTDWEGVGGSGRGGVGWNANEVFRFFESHNYGPWFLGKQS